VLSIISRACELMARLIHLPPVLRNMDSPFQVIQTRTTSCQRRGHLTTCGRSCSLKDDRETDCGQTKSYHRSR